MRRVFGWNTFEILSPIMGNPNNPVNAVSPRAEAMCHMRFVPMPDASTFTAAILKHLDRNGLTATELEATRDVMQATRLDPGHPWVQWLRQSVEQTTGNKVDVIPNLGGSLPTKYSPKLLACRRFGYHIPMQHVLSMRRTNIFCHLLAVTLCA